MDQSKEDIINLVRNMLPTTKEELMKDIISGDYDTTSYGLMDYINIKYNKAFPDGLFEFDWEFVIDYYLSQYLHLFVETNIICKFLEKNEYSTIIFNNNNRVWCVINQHTPYGKDVLLKLKESKLNDLTAVHD